MAVKRFQRIFTSCSAAVPLSLSRASASSMNIVAGALNLASWNNTRISFSLSPRHLLARDEHLMLKKVVSNLEATALASIVLPVPGGPNNRREDTHFTRLPPNSGRIIGLALRAELIVHVDLQRG